jgi:hypothetical protein
MNTTCVHACLCVIMSCTVHVHSHPHYVQNIPTTLNYTTIARTSYSVMMVGEIPGIINCFRPKLPPAAIHSWTSVHL